MYKEGNTGKAKGLYPFRIKYFDNDGPHGIELYYENKECTSGRYISIPKESFSVNDYLPYFSYKYILNYYYINREIDINYPLYNGIDKLTNLQIAPKLPDGLEFNSNTGEIKGIPTKIEELTKYTIYGYDKFQEFYKVEIEIGVENVESPKISGYYEGDVKVTTLTLVLYKEITEIIPKVDTIVSEYSISPELPDGLYLDTSTGIISGTPNLLVPQKTYVIKASNQAGESTYEINIIIDTCNSNELYVIFEHQTGDKPLEESFEVKSESTIVLTSILYTKENTTYRQYVCLTKDIFTLTATDTGNDGWKYPLYVKLEGDIILTTINVNSGSGRYSFQVESIVSPGETIYVYDSQNEPKSDWMENRYNNENWEQVLPLNIPISLAQNNKIYIKKLINVGVSLTAISIIHLSFKYEEGIKVYFNKNEIWRDRINDKDEVIGEKYVKFTGVDLKISSDMNVETNSINIILYRNNITRDFIVFDMIVTISDGFYNIAQGISCVSSVNMEGINTNYLVDNNPETVFKLQGVTKVKLTCNFQRDVYINKLFIQTPKYNEDAPNSWVLYGKNNNMKDYAVLNSENNVKYSTVNYNITIDLLNATSYYNNIMLDILSTSNNDPIVSISSLNFIISVWEKCVAYDNWPDLDRGLNVTVLCPKGYTGYRSRYCEDAANPKWLEIDDKDCTPGTPYSIEYTNKRLSFSVNKEVFQEAPVVVGFADVFNIYPSLPNNLVFNKSTGEIYGIPIKSLRWQWFNITAGNSKHLVNGIIEVVYTYLYISIDEEGCTKEGEWPSTLIGQIAIINCGIDYGGKQKRKCELKKGTLTPEWQEIDRSQCIPLPPVNLTYNTPIIAYRGVDMNESKPSVINSIRKYKITPNLPSGLKFDPLYGTILGNAVNKEENRSYIITGTNTIGSVQTNITLRVDLVLCKKENAFEPTERNANITISCGSGYAGFQTRKCCDNDNDILSPIWCEVDRHDCVELFSNPRAGTINLNLRLTFSPVSDSNYVYEAQSIFRKIISENQRIEYEKVLILSYDIKVFIILFIFIFVIV